VTTSTPIKVFVPGSYNVLTTATPMENLGFAIPQWMDTTFARDLHHALVYKFAWMPMTVQMKAPVTSVAAIQQEIQEDVGL
jgi:hypothetical protein